jgi:general secretion pathway protein A
MEELGGNPDAGAARPRTYSLDDFTLPSHLVPLSTLRAALASQNGPVLLVGEPGAGKTWLWRRLRSERMATWRWAVVELTPAVGPSGFYRLMGHSLGIGELNDPATARAAVCDFLREASTDGARWVFVVEEAHNATDAVAEEIRVLCNQLGRRDGFAALLLVGQTALVRRLATRPLASLGARLAARVVLAPIDADEAHALVAQLVPDRAWQLEAFERMHRDAGGNPRRILMAALSHPGARTIGRPSERPQPAWPERSPELAEEPGEPAFAAEPETNLPVLGAARPPIREEDGVIEVGWVPEPETEPETASSTEGIAPAGRPGEFAGLAPAAVPLAVLPPAPAGDESIDDHYAALRAWSEWATNQGRSPIAASNAATRQAPEPIEAAPSEKVAVHTPAASSPNVWAEGQHAFAPYSQLFSRLRQPRDME